MLAVGLCSGALSSYGHALLRRGEVRAVSPFFSAAHAVSFVAHLAASAVWIGLCASLSALPAWVGARGAARAARALAVVELLQPIAGMAVTLVVLRGSGNAASAGVLHAALAVAGALVHTAYVLLVATAVDRATTALDRSRPARLTPWALFASALAFGSILSSALTVLLGLAGGWFLAAGFVFHGALSSLLAWGWARGLHTASAALAAQRWPESHRGGPDAP
jgi:hypothetical protein